MPEPMDPFATLEYLNKKDSYEITEADQQIIATGVGQLVGQFLLDRNGVVRWTFSEVLDGGLARRPNSEEMMSAASEIGQSEWSSSSSVGHPFLQVFALTCSVQFLCRCAKVGANEHDQPT